MDPKIIPLYYLSSFAGLLMVAGGIWLLYKEKIYIDRESKEITEIETPIGKFKTNAPALALFVLGFIPLIYPIWNSAGFVQEIMIKGNVKATTFPVQVYAVIKSDSLMQNRAFSLQLPVNDEYKIIYIAGSVILEDLAEIGQKQNGEILLPPKDITPARPVAYEPSDVPKPPEFQ
jgi:hypothetical protein